MEVRDMAVLSGRGVWITRMAEQNYKYFGRFSSFHLCISEVYLAALLGFHLDTVSCWQWKESAIRYWETQGAHMDACLPALAAIIQGFYSYSFFFPLDFLFFSLASFSLEQVIHKFFYLEKKMHSLLDPPPRAIRIKRLQICMQAEHSTVARWCVPTEIGKCR